MAFSFGQFVQFDETGFIAYNGTMCGNDVRIVTDGTWKWIADDRIEVFVNNIERNEYCSKPSAQPKKTIGVFKLLWQNDEKTSLNLERDK